jgi:hypothetical protein
MKYANTIWAKAEFPNVEMGFVDFISYDQQEGT